MPGKTKVSFLLHQRRSDLNAGGAMQSLAGWSETWYSTLGVKAEQLYSFIHQWMTLRAALLGPYASIVGYRVSTVDPSGPSYAKRKVMGGSSGLDVDNPEQCLVINVSTDEATNRRSIILRGIPDSKLALGDWVRGDPYERAIKNFLEHCRDNWRFRGKTRTLAAKKIQNITAQRNIVCAEPHGIAESTARVQIYRTITPEGRQVGVQDITCVVTDPQTLVAPSTLDIPLPCTGGQLRMVEGHSLYQFFLPANWKEDVHASTRDTGRPFFVRRGRRSAQRS